jgi:hypothetical protein
MSFYWLASAYGLEFIVGVVFVAWMRRDEARRSLGNGGRARDRVR